MQAKKLNQIQKNIRKNWGKVTPFKLIPKKHFNCYMFAVCCTVPTEILTRTGTCISKIDESVTYFGSMGQFSGTKYKTREQYKIAWLNDLRVLGIYAEECSEDFIPTEDTIKVAFYSNFEEGMSRSEEQFHFFRYVPSKRRWMGKEGFPGGFQKNPRDCNINRINVTEQKRLGIFKLSLIQK